MSIRFCWFVELLSSSISLLVFCVVVLSVIEVGLLKCPIITVDLTVSLFSSVSFSSCFLKLSCWAHTHLGLLCLHSGLILLSLGSVTLYF